jgi:hypothetical protein
MPQPARDRATVHVMADNPLWLQAILRVERIVGEPLESALRSDTYFDGVTAANRLTGRLMRTAESLSRQWLHLWNLPAYTDILGVQQQIARLERDMARAATDLADVEERSQAPAGATDALTVAAEIPPSVAADLNAD